MFKGGEHDRLAIRELLDSCSHAVMSRDAKAFERLWDQEAVWEFRGSRVEGRPEIIKTWLNAMADIEAVTLNMFPGSILVDGDRAEIFTHTFEHVVMQTGEAFFLAGTYQDKLVRREEWLFGHRIFTARRLTVSGPS
jgi:hypothetical protein